MLQGREDISNMVAHTFFSKPTHSSQEQPPAALWYERCGLKGPVNMSSLAVACHEPRHTPLQNHRLTHLYGPHVLGFSLSYTGFLSTNTTLLSTHLLY